MIELIASSRESAQRAQKRRKGQEDALSPMRAARHEAPVQALAFKGWVRRTVPAEVNDAERKVLICSGTVKEEHRACLIPG